MRIGLNLSPPPSARDRIALAWAIPATLAGLALLVVLSRATLKEYREYRGINTQLNEVQVRVADLQYQEQAIRRKLDDPAYRDLLHRAGFVNDLIERREFSLSTITARLAGLLPEDAHLTGLAVTSPKKPGDTYNVRMGIAARNEDAIETFLNDLEDAPDFKDVAIINQGFQEENSQQDLVNVMCSAHYLPGVNINAEKPSEEEPAPNRKSHH